MKKLLALVVLVVLVVLASGCVEEPPEEHTNCTWALPHARIILVDSIGYDAPLTIEVANFSTFQELANGTVYAEKVYGAFGGLIGLDLNYIAQEGTLIVYHVSFENCPGIGSLVVENNTIKVEG